MVDIEIIKERLGLTGNSAFDAMLTAMEAAAAAFVENETHRYFGAERITTEALKGTGTQNLFLAEAPLTVVGLAVDEQAYAGDPNPVAMALNTDFEIRYAPRNAAKLVRWLGNLWWRGREYVVTYVDGYAWIDPYANDIAAPDEIREVVMRLVTAMFATFKAAGQGAIQSESIDNYSYTLADVKEGAADVLDFARRTLAHWKRRFV